MSSQLYRSSSTQRKIAAGLVSLVLFGTIQLSHAAPITLQNTAGAWTGYTLAPGDISYAGSLVQTANYAGTNGGIMNGLFWGESPQTGGPQSALLFNPTSNGSAITLGTAFALGTLSHYNYSIWSDTAITNANLQLQLTLAGTGSVTTGPFNYNFSIFETPNNTACPSWQVSAIPCDDKVSFSAASTSQQFSLDGQNYSFNLLGFYKNPTTLVSDMITTEQTATAQWLMASITAAPATVTTTTPVPAPAALWLLGSGLLGLAGFAKRKRIPQ